MKSRIICATKIIVFILLFVFLFQRISWTVEVYAEREDGPDRRACLFYSLPRDTVDVMFVGTSHIYCTFVPQQIYDDSGITSASVATSSQSFANSYWLIKEALLYQKPKIVVMDIHPVCNSLIKDVQNFKLHFTSGMVTLPDTSVNKIFAYKDVKGLGYGWAENMTVYDAYSILAFKDGRDRKSMDMLEVMDIFISPASQYKTFGFFATDTVYPMDALDESKVTDNYVKLEDTVEFEWLNRIYDLCESEDIELVMTRAPYYRGGDDYHIYEQAFAWMEEKEIPFVDYFELIDETEIDLKTDFRDGDHLNYLGAKKATAYITDYFTREFDLEDHRGDSRYYLWEQRDFDYEQVEATIKKKLEE